MRSNRPQLSRLEFDSLLKRRDIDDQAYDVEDLEQDLETLARLETSGLMPPAVIVVVADTSPLSYLIQISCDHVLLALYERVVAQATAAAPSYSANQNNAGIDGTITRIGRLAVGQTIDFHRYRPMPAPYLLTSSSCLAGPRSRSARGVRSPSAALA